MLNSDSSKAHFDSGNAHYKKMAYDEAIEDYTVAIKLKPDESTYLNSRGNAYYSRGVKYSDKKDYDLAITDYTTAIKLKPDNSVYLYNRGNAYYNKEDYDLAIADFEAALRINPDYANAKRDIKNAQQAQSKLKQNSQNIAIKQKSNFNESSSSTAKSSSSADRIPQQKTLLTTRSSSTVKNNSRTFSEIDSPSNELRNLCYKERSIGGYCGVGLWTSNSKDTALQIAIFHAKGDMALNIRNEISIVGNWLSSITDSVSEKITGIRSHSKLNKNGNKMKNSEICTIVNVKGKVSLVKISEDSHIVEYYILVNGKIAGSCTYQKGDEKLGMEEAELYTVKVSEGVPDIQIQKTRTIYDQEKKEYTVYVLVTLPKALVSE
jgi:Tfp pilus assembly protein PilF